MSSKILLMTAINLIITPSNGASTQTDPVKFVCVGESLSVLWTLKYTDDEVTEVAIINPHDQTYVSQKWKAEPTIYVTRTSLIWNKGSTSDHITFRIENASRDDDGNNELHVYYGGEFEIAHILPLHVLTACPDRESYRNPAVSYQTKSSPIQPVKNNILSLFDPGIVTISVQIPAANPPVAAKVSLRETIHTCKRRTENGSVCEARLFFDTSPNQRVNVTLTFVAWTPSTTVIYVLLQFSPDDTSLASKPPVPTSSVDGFPRTSHTGISIGKTVAAVLLPLVVIGCIISCVFFYWKRIRRKRRKNVRAHRSESPSKVQDSSGQSLIPAGNVPNATFIQGTSSETSIVENYIAMLNNSVSDKVKQRNKAMNLPFGIDRDKLFYMKLAMVPQRACGSQADIEEYIVRSIHTNEANSIAIEELFDPFSSRGNIPRRVLLLGGAGMGKTTVCQEQIRILAEKNHAHRGSEIRATFFFECRRLAPLIQSKKELSLADLLLQKHQPGNLTEREKGVILRYLDTNQSHIQITVDGLDELAQLESYNDNEIVEIVDINEKAKIPDIFLNLIKKHPLPKANVFVTSRPTSYVMKRDYDNVIIALGFSKVSIIDCLQTICNEDEKLYTAVMFYIVEHGLLLHCMVPLTCVLLGAVLVGELSTESFGGMQFTIDSMTRLYTRVNLECIWRRQDKQNTSQPKTIFDLTSLQRTALLNLASLAASGMFGEDTVVVFDNKSLSEAKCLEVDNFGLLEVAHEETAATHFVKFVTAHFIHLTEQEFLAALSVCVSWKKNEVEKLMQSDCQRLEMVRQFAAGLLGDPVCQRLVKAVNPKTNETTLRERAEELVLAMAGSNCNLSDKKRKSNTLLTITCVKEGRMDTLVPMLDDKLLEKARRYQTLNLSSTTGGIPQHYLPAIGCFLQNSNICTGLNMEMANVDAQGVSSLEKATTGKTGLKYLIMDTNNFGAEGMVALQPLIQRNGSLEVLGLRSCQIDYEGACTLSNSLSDHTKLWELGLYGNNIEIKGAKALANAIGKCSSLQTLWLGNNSIEDEGTEFLAESLKNCPTIQKLELGKNNIKDKGAKALAAALSKCSKLVELGLERNKIGDDGAVELAQGLQNCPSLSKLSLEDNCIGDTGALKLAEAMRKCTTLHKLKLWVNNNISEDTKDSLLQEFQGRIIFKQF